MTEKRKIEIVDAANEHGEGTVFCDLVYSPLARGVNSAYGIGFIEGAVWADETIVEKACAWIADNFPLSDKTMATSFADDFRKTMTGDIG